MAFRNTGLELLLRGQLRVCRGRRVDRERARVADICDMVKHLQRVDEPAAGLAAAPELETQQGAVAALEIGIGTAFGLTAHLARKDHLGDLRMSGEMVRNRVRIRTM